MNTNENGSKGVLENMRLRLLNEQLFYKDLIRIYDDVRYVISLDIGGGNCSASVLDVDLMKTYEDDEKLDAIVSLNTQPGSFSTPSAVGYKIEPDGKERVLIGKAAAEQADFMFTNYKVVPTSDNLDNVYKAPDGHPLDSPNRKTIRQLMTDYIRMLYQSILNSNDENVPIRDCARREILVLVGVPSGEEWQTDEVRKNLKEIIVAATSGDPDKAEEQVWLMSESDASILYMMGRYPKKSMDRLMIVDLGAYSADITYIDKETGERFKMSIKLGGKEIERLIKDCFVGRDMDEKDRERIKEKMLDYFIRMGKELHWPRAEGDAEFKVFADVSPYKVDAKNMKQCVTIKKFGCESVLGEGRQMASYTEHLRRFLDNFVRTCSKEKEREIRPDVMLVVGGAANMRPAYDAIVNFCKEKDWVHADGTGIEVYPAADAFSNSLTSLAVPEGMLKYYVKTMMYINKLPDIQKKLIQSVKDYLSIPLYLKLKEKLPNWLFNPNTGLVPLIAYHWKDSGKTYDDLIDWVVERMKNGSVMKGYYDEIIPPIVHTFIKEAQKIMNEAAEGFLPDGVRVQSEKQADMKNAIYAQVRQKIADRLENDITEILRPVISQSIWGIIRSIAHIFESEEERRKRLRQENKEYAAAMGKMLTWEERDRLYNRLSSSFNVFGGQTRRRAGEQIVEELPGALDKVFNDELIDSLNGALMSGLQEALEFAAFM